MPVNQISAIDAFDILQKDKNSVLVDVRTFEEFNFVGTVNADEFGGRMLLNPWRLTMSMNENPAFADDLEKMLKNLFGKENKEAKLFFICRTGARSDSAARLTSELGYSKCFNITSGFEGDLDQSYQRGKMSGWKAENLPWKQA